MSDNKYHYTEDPFNVTRRQFITITGIIVALAALPTIWIRSIVSSGNAYIISRTKGLYSDDEKSAIRVSHANTAVARYYEEFGGDPLGHLSHKLLHTHYIDRSKGLAL